MGDGLGSCSLDELHGLETQLEQSLRNIRERKLPMDGDLYALDFDGVLCDSCGENSRSALKAAKIRWPSIFDQVDSAMEEWIIDQMYILRPVVETGYENLLLVRLLVELQVPAVRKSSVSDELSTGAILENWLQIKPTIMKEWNEERCSNRSIWKSKG